MGLFGGSKSSSNQTTNVTTETETNIGDIGLTGDDAITLAAVTSGSAERLSTQQLRSLDVLARTSSDNVRQGYTALSDLSAVSERVSRDSFGTARDIGGQAIDAAGGVRQSSENLFSRAASLLEQFAGNVGAYGSEQLQATSAQSAQALTVARDTIESSTTGPTAQLVRQLPVIVGVIAAAAAGYAILRKG